MKEIDFENLIEETTERIVIEYANLSGREDTSRATFRRKVWGHLDKLVGQAYRKGVEDELKCIEKSGEHHKNCKK